MTSQLDVIDSVLATRYPMFRKVTAARIGEFGPSWRDRFERELEARFDGDAAVIERAVDGYVRFCLEAMRLQKEFTRSLAYNLESYEQAVAEVYGNREYMAEVYLPALLLSHYLWPHHFRQIGWTEEHFFAKLRQRGTDNFCDVGIGTGFYSKETLIALPHIRGWGFDISAASMEHTERLLTRWGVSDRYEICSRPIGPDYPRKFDAFITIELLEHLEDPQAFLCTLRESVAPGALGLVTAAIDAPNRDHIFLYRDLASVAQQLEHAGFRIRESALFVAYEKMRPSDTVPQSGCFVVTAE